MGKHVLFICTGNTCRSPLAEVLARHMFGHLGIRFGSAGLHPPAAQGASPGSLAFASGLGLSLADHLSRPVAVDELAGTAWVIGMTRSHAAIFKSRFGGYYHGGIGVLGAAGVDLAMLRNSPPVEEVDDPFGQSEETYHSTGRQIQRLLESWGPVFEKLGKAES